MKRETDHKLDETGNWRAIQETVDHDVRWVYNDREETSTDLRLEHLIIGCLIVSIVLFVSLIIGICFICFKQN